MQEINKLCVVTGASQGIGKATALGLASMGYHVVIVSRDPERAQSACREILASTDNPFVSIELADLSRLDEIHQLATRLNAKYSRLDVLVNNHTALFPKRQVSFDRIEMNFALNYLSYFLLTVLLIDKLKQSKARVINVAAEAHRAIDHKFMDDIFSENYDFWDAYCKAKLCTILFTYALSRRVTPDEVTVNCLHPGTAQTKALSDVREFYTAVHGPQEFPQAGSPEFAAETSLFASIAPELQSISGKYLVDKQAVKSSEMSYDVSIQEYLWEISEALTGASL